MAGKEPYFITDLRAGLLKEMGKKNLPSHAKIKTEPNVPRLESLFRVTKVATGAILIFFKSCM